MAATEKTNYPDIIRQTSACLSRHIKPGANLRVALSGGVDSVVLLHLLTRLGADTPFQLSAMHVHHGLSIHADDWVAHCQTLCQKLGVPLEVARVSIGQKSGTGLEATARKARYDELTRPGADALVLAHHLDDQAETVLFQLLRGGEPRALAAMPEAREKNGVLMIRPLLGVPKRSLIAYAKRHRLQWVEDDSNADTTLARNALRRDVLPLLEKHFPDYRARLAGVARRMAEVAGLLQGLAGQDGAVDQASELDCKALRALGEARARNLLAHFLRDSNVPLPRPAAMREMLRQLQQAQGRLSLPLPDGRKLRRIKNRVFIEP